MQEQWINQSVYTPLFTQPSRDSPVCNPVSRVYRDRPTRSPTAIRITPVWYKDIVFLLPRQIFWWVMKCGLSNCFRLRAGEHVLVTKPHGLNSELARALRCFECCLPVIQLWASIKVTGSSRRFTSRLNHRTYSIIRYDYDMTCTWGIQIRAPW